MTVNFCVAALEEARSQKDNPDMSNTNQGRPFTGTALTAVLHESRRPDQHGRQGRAARQRLHRAAFSIWQVQGGPPARLRQCLGCQGVDRAAPDLLQREPPMFGAWRADARSHILQATPLHPGSSI